MEQMTRYQVYKACPIPGLEAFLAYYADGEVDKPLIESTLEKAFVGKSFHPYGSVGAICNQIIRLISNSKKLNYLAEDYSLTWNRDSASKGHIYYKKMWLGSIAIRKKKGKWHCGYWGTSGSYDWSISSIEVEGFSDIQARAAEIVLALDKRNDEEGKRFKDACRIYRTIKEMFPNDSAWQIEMKIKYLEKNLWKIEKEIQG